ncbi:MAG: hypothetical protein ACRCVG_05985 [Methanobacteriaceae archaeon]
MVGKNQKIVKNHLVSNELNKKIKAKKIPAKLLKKLEFIKALYKEADVAKTCEKVKISEAKGYHWG